MIEYRIEKDSLGEVEVPLNALYGAQTVRAMNNFHITEIPVNPLMFTSLAKVKKACALANFEVGDLNKEISDAIVSACDEIIAGKHLEYFVTDSIQGGAGTSLNMNINEIISNRANEILGGTYGQYDLVHPNDHSNKAQSTNDIIPTAGKLTILELSISLLNEMELLAKSFEHKAEEFQDIIKVGRTHLQDAVLISMAQVFNSYATFIHRDIKRIKTALDEMKDINLGATAVGTGINSGEGYRELAVKNLSLVTNLPFRSSLDLIDGTKHIDGFAYVHSSLKNFAIALSRMSNDLRLMASGPLVGLSEIQLPSRQPGSSIMPGKVNPVIPEVVNQVCFQVIGNDTTVNMAVEAGQMELNVFEPVIFKNIFESFEILTNACHTLRLNAVNDMIVNEEVVNANVENSLAMATALLKPLGYDKVSELTQEALERKMSLRDIVLEKKLLNDEELNTILDPSKLIKPNRR